MSRFQAWFERYERRISALAIISAFVIDSVTLERIDALLTQAFLAAYVIIVATGIIMINLRENGRLQFMSEGIYSWLFVIVQFCFGGLFGRFFIYYSRSGAFAANWPFLILFLALLIGNEFSKKYYTRLLLQVSFFYLALFAYMVLLVPLIVRSIGAGIFIISGIFSLFLMYWFIETLVRLIPERIKHERTLLRGVVGIIFIVMNVLYFTNSIPPIPLAVREAGVYHSVQRVGTEYHVTAEKSSFWSRVALHPTIHRLANEPVYIFSAVYAPADFGESIAYRWESYDDTTHSWHAGGLVSYPIVGGSEYGYRGYAFKSNITPGLWRVSIETVRGQVLGRVTFTVENVAQEPELVTKTF
jgi:hypothetical protein